jgi:hypothetical protein
MMEKRKPLQEKAFGVFFKIFNEYGTEFNDDFWREIFS